jgi:hypothetical protein
LSSPCFQRPWTVSYLNIYVCRPPKKKIINNNRKTKTAAKIKINK